MSAGEGCGCGLQTAGSGLRWPQPALALRADGPAVVATALSPAARSWALQIETTCGHLWRLRLCGSELERAQAEMTPGQAGLMRRAAAWPSLSS